MRGKGLGFPCAAIIHSVLSATPILGIKQHFMMLTGLPGLQVVVLVVALVAIGLFL